jgi:hypothetical protein
MNPAAFGALLRGDMENFKVASPPGGIEAQEARGQRDFVASETLPKELLHGTTRAQLEALGIVFGEDADDLFVKATLPPGWKKVASDHAMWSYLHDDQGRKRASIFYKAAFYDRSAHMNLEPRYYVQSRYDTPQAGQTTVSVMDAGKPLKDFGTASQSDSYEVRDAMRQQAAVWLAQQYPDHKNPNAYW